MRSSANASKFSGSKLCCFFPTVLTIFNGDTQFPTVHDEPHEETMTSITIGSCQDEKFCHWQQVLWQQALLLTTN
jgi:hypothetical protein